jgi:hypothetical protein
MWRKHWVWSQDSSEEPLEEHNQITAVVGLDDFKL